MASINQVTLLGRVGQKPTTSTAASGVSIAKFSLATSRKVNNAEETQWHNIVCFSGAADFAGKYLNKGDQVVVIGEIKYNKYTDNKGIEKVLTSIIANNVQQASRKEQATNDLP